MKRHLYIPSILILTALCLIACGTEVTTVSKAAQPGTLTGSNWLWQGAELANGSTAEPYTSPTFSPSIRFTTEPARNSGESGLIFGGNMGCNGMGGTYTADASGGLTIFGVGSTEMLCEDERMAGDLLWGELAIKLHRYEVDADELRLFTSAGDEFVFSREVATSAESNVYAAVINDWGDSGYLFVSDPAFNRAGVSAEETRQQLEALFPQRGEREAISAELLDAFFTAQTDMLNLTLPNGTPTFITQAELDNIFANGEEQGWQTIAERFPDVQLIFTFSNVGFSDNEALVYNAIRTPQQEAGYYSIRVAGNGNYLGNSTSLLWSANE